MFSLKTNKLFAVLAIALAALVAAPANSALARPLPLTMTTDTPVITGDAVFGSLLAASPGTNWTIGASLTYQWNRNGTAISGATSTTYLVALADIGTTLSVTVTGTKSLYNNGVATSVSTATVTRATLASTPQPTIDTSPVVGGLVTTTVGYWTTGASLSYQWYLNGIVIPGATDSSYTPTGLDYNGFLSFAVTGSKTGYTTATSSSWSYKVAAATQTNQGAAPTLDVYDNYVVFDSVVATDLDSAWDDGVTRAYQWQRNGTNIADATSTSYQFTVADIGANLRLCVTGSKTGYNDVVVCTASHLISKRDLSVGNPGISGVSRVGSELSATTVGWNSGLTKTYQWTIDGTAIDGATNSTYTPVASDLGHAIAVEVTGDNGNTYNAVVKTSDSVNISSGIQSSVGSPSISGQMKVGETLTAVPGMWDAGVTLTYAWLLDGSPITGATDSTYVLTFNDLHHVITVRVTGSKDGYESASADSTNTDSVSARSFTGPAPQVSGAVTVGSLLTADTQGWDPDVTFQYQWLIDGAEIAGAVQQTYTPLAADNGHDISVRVTGSKDFTYLPDTETSSATTVQPGDQTEIGTPQVLGVPNIGRTVYANEGSWAAGATFTYQWERNGQAIAGATSRSYKLLAGDYGSSIAVVVTASVQGYTDAAQTSATVIGGTDAPLVYGTARVNSTLIVDPGFWDAGTALSYVWKANNRVIAVQNGNTLLLTADEARKRISVEITGVKTGSAAVVKKVLYNKVVAPAIIETVGTPSISAPSGTTYADDLLSVDAGVWSDGVGFIYSWYKNGQLLGAIDGPVYAIAPSDAGAIFTVVVTGVKPGYASVSKKTSLFRVVGARNFGGGTVSVSGSNKVGSNLLVATSGWGSDVTYSYTWLRNGAVIDGATDTFYTLTADDAGKRVVAVVTIQKYGYRTVVKKSKATALVYRG